MILQQNEDAVKLVQKFQKILKSKKAIFYSWSTIKTKYFNEVALKILKKNKDLIVWL